MKSQKISGCIWLVFTMAGVLLPITTFGQAADSGTGVITGTVKLADGRPVVGESVTILPVVSTTMALPDRKSVRFSNGVGSFDPVTDDRGRYRAWHLRAGRYKVAVGRKTESAIIGDRKTYYQQTFSPSTTNPAEAQIIEVTDRTESQADITLSAEVDTFSISGKVFDEASNQPVAGVIVGYVYSSKGRSSQAMGPQTDAFGNFEINGVLPGDYSLYVPGGANDFASTRKVGFTVKDADVAGLQIAVSKAKVIEGRIVIQENGAAALSNLYRRLFVNVWRSSSESARPEMLPVQIAPDGSFQLKLITGEYRIMAPAIDAELPALESITIDNRTSDGRFTVNAANTPREICLLFASGSGILEGRVTTAFPLAASVTIVIAGSSGVIGPLTSNPDGTFRVEKVKPGDYLISVTAKNNQQLVAIGKGSVTVKKNIITPVTIALQKVE